ncbi:hypothetical protein SD80_013135 [Scytonema tolypothrichoides VB-61278]|nr:hypothetical protein SD80_013135 [Scytonema tolypothrichoides VB-61278]
MEKIQTRAHSAVEYEPCPPSIKIWDWGSGEQIRNLKGHSDSVYAIAISPDGLSAMLPFPKSPSEGLY